MFYAHNSKSESFSELRGSLLLFLSVLKHGYVFFKRFPDTKLCQNFPHSSCLGPYQNHFCELMVSFHVDTHIYIYIYVLYNYASLTRTWFSDFSNFTPCQVDRRVRVSQAHTTLFLKPREQSVKYVRITESSQGRY